MKELIDKIEDFFFDFLGLILPGFFMILLVTTPLSLLDIKDIDPSVIEKSKILSILVNLARYTNYFISNQTEIVIILTILLSYINGHLVKVMSILQYEFLTAIFDKFLNKIFISLKTLVKRFINWIFAGLLKSEKQFWIETFKVIKDLYTPIKRLFIKIFTFQAPNYFSDNEVLRDDCIDLINDKFKTEFPKKWYSFYKFSTVISNQENVKSLSPIFLAKYNFYRSMAFIFSLIFIYYIVFFTTANAYLSVPILSLRELILVAIGLLWYTFHYKYKRYWTLCGNETLVSLFYYMKKNYV